MLNNPKITPILLIVVSVLLAGLLAVELISLRGSQAQSALLLAAVADTSVQLGELTAETESIRTQLAEPETAEQGKLLARHLQALGIVDTLEAQDDLIISLFENYQGDAYGTSIDRIAEQQLIATEYQLVALQALGLQNRQIADLLLLDYLDAPADLVDAVSGDE